MRPCKFPLGTIAISGPNGAGKSTILEAIGFALFDCLPYRNQREFMRHNATEADVRVSFLSRLDECEYQAVRTLRRYDRQRGFRHVNLLRSQL